MGIGQKDYLQIAAQLPFRIYTTSEVAQLLRLSKHTVYQYVRMGIIEPIKPKSEKEGRKHCKSYFTDAEVIKAVEYRFPSMLPEQKKAIRERLLGGKKHGKERGA